MQEVQRRQRELDRPGAEVLPPREPLLARFVCLGHDARHRVAALRDAFAEVQEATRRPLLVECTLIRGVNDQAEHARQLVALLQPLARVKVNLIPYNRNLGLGSVGDRFEPSPAESVLAFRRLVVEAGLFCSVRRQRGAESAAACGMLATAQNRRTSPRDENSVVRPGRK